MFKLEVKYLARVCGKYLAIYQKPVVSMLIYLSYSDKYANNLKIQPTKFRTNNDFLIFIHRLAELLEKLIILIWSVISYSPMNTFI